MRSIAISRDRMRPLASSLRRTLAGALVACAVGGPAATADWPSELGPVLSWAPPAGAADPGRCNRIVDRDRDPGASIQSAVDAAGPGAVVCVRSTYHRDEFVEVSRSGEPGRPLELLALGEVVTGGFVVAADDVVIRGFTVETGAAADAEDWRAGFSLRGRRLGIIDNTATDPAGYGIYCSRGAPHTDCFQNFDSGRPATRDVVIENNVCFDVDHQCLIAEAPVRREGADLAFRRNICANNGSQGVMVRELDGVLVEKNIFLSTIYFNAVVLRREVTDTTIRCNLVVGRPALHEIDQSSRRGLRITGSQRAESPAAAPAARAALAKSGCNLPPLSPWPQESVILAGEMDGGSRP